LFVKAQGATKRSSVEGESCSKNPTFKVLWRIEHCGIVSPADRRGTSLPSMSPMPRFAHDHSQSGNVGARGAMPGPSVKLFLSCVSGEFGDYRDALRRALTRPNVEVKIQEDFKALGGDTLNMLEEYIEQCEAVIHFVGVMAGSTPAAVSVDDLLMRRPDLKDKLGRRGLGRDALNALTYTQWEAWLAVALTKDLLIVEPAATVVRGPNFTPTDASRTSQTEHLESLRAINRYPVTAFTSADNLVAQIFGTAVIDALVKAGKMFSPRKPRNLPFASLGDLFKGRDMTLDQLHHVLTRGRPNWVVLQGLPGLGKRRVAIEYAWRHQAFYSALLFARADNPTTLKADLAALAGTSVLDLPEKDAREDEAKIEAVLRWLEANPIWLLILDNVEFTANNMVENLMRRLTGGHVIVTAPRVEFPGDRLQGLARPARRTRGNGISSGAHGRRTPDREGRRGTGAQVGAGVRRPSAWA
jgi:hypothetical protein